MISSSQEEEILTAVKNEIPLPESNKEESCKSDEEHMFELEIEKDEEGISGDHHANESCIEHRFQVSVSLDQFCFCFCFYFVNLHLQFLISHTFEYIRSHFVNIFLLLLHVWFHWKFHYT